jgi:hypothetical protein
VGTDIVGVYCLFDELLKGIIRVDDPKAKVGDAEILTVEFK